MSRQSRPRLATLAAIVGLLVFATLRQQVSPQAAPQPAPAAPLREIGNLLVGRWMLEVTFAVDYPGVGKKGEKVTGYDICAWVADGAAFECAGYAGKNTWKALYWWDAATKQVRFAGVDSAGNWDVGTLAKQGANVTGASSGAFIDGRLVQYEWEATFTDGGRTRVVTGATILAGVKSPFRDTHRKIN